MTGTEEFTRATAPHRGELLAHCYRMLGSADEAEDLVQETYLRAWRSYDAFEGRASVRTWLYRIATNACLTALDRRTRRPLPSGLGAPAEDASAPLVARPDVPWLTPLPDAALVTGYDDPASVVAARAGIRLALVAALQYLSARQRAILILRDVLEWPAAEVADLLGTTTTAVNSGLRRARAQLERVLPVEDDLVEPTAPRRRALLDAYAEAVENADAEALSKLLRADIVLEMPPITGWFTGRDPVMRVITGHLLAPPGQLRLVPVAVNGQPGFAVYRRESDGRWHAHAVQVLTPASTGLAAITVFVDPSVFGPLGLPAVAGPDRPTPTAVPWAR